MNIMQRQFGPKTPRGEPRESHREISLGDHENSHGETKRSSRGEGGGKILGLTMRILMVTKRYLTVRFLLVTKRNFLVKEFTPPGEDFLVSP